MKTIWQGLIIAIVFVVFAAIGLYYWNLAAIAELERQYSTENMHFAAEEQFSKDIEKGLVRIVGLFMNSHLYGSLSYPNVPADCIEVLVDKYTEIYVEQLLTVEQAYWREQYHVLYPGPYLHYAEEYNARIVQYLHRTGEPCLG